MWVEKTKCQVLGNGTQRAKKRGVEDIFIACTDNLTGFSAAIGAVFPKTEIQNCIIHQLRNSSKYVTPFLNPKTKATVLFWTVALLNCLVAFLHDSHAHLH